MDLIVEPLNVPTVCQYRYAQKKETHSVRAKDADCTCTQSTKNKVQRWALWRCTTINFYLTLFDFRLFFGLNFKKQLHYNRISFHLHTVTSGQQLCFSDFRHTHLVYSPFLAYQLSQNMTILATDVTLDRSKRTFALYIDLDTSTS